MVIRRQSGTRPLRLSPARRVVAAGWHRPRLRRRVRLPARLVPRPQSRHLATSGGRPRPGARPTPGGGRPARPGLAVRPGGLRGVRGRRGRGLGRGEGRPDRRPWRPPSATRSDPAGLGGPRLVCGPCHPGHVRSSAPPTRDHRVSSFSGWPSGFSVRGGEGERSGWLPPWPLVVLFLAWANTDRGFVVGLGVVAAVMAGRTLDGPRRRSAPGRRPPRTGRCRPRGGLPLESGPPPRVRTAPGVAAGRPGSGGLRAVVSPFDRGYLDVAVESPAGLAYFPLLGLRPPFLCPDGSRVAVGTVPAVGRAGCPQCGSGAGHTVLRDRRRARPWPRIFRPSLGGRVRRAASPRGAGWPPECSPRCSGWPSWRRPGPGGSRARRSSRGGGRSKPRRPSGRGRRRSASGGPPAGSGRRPAGSTCRRTPPPRSPGSARPTGSVNDPDWWRKLSGARRPGPTGPTGCGPQALPTSSCTKRTGSGGPTAFGRLLADPEQWPLL